jgi:hypothetical protein
MTVIATGFTERRDVLPSGGKVVDLPRTTRSSPAAAAGAWRRRAGELRAEGEESIEADDLDVPAFLRRQAD